ncbi:MAG: YkvA family protein [Gammaproteobacteria bacterium]|nr:YkvA family protein [Gammaproteobacteria bacterium]
MKSWVSSTGGIRVYSEFDQHVRLPEAISRKKSAIIRKDKTIPLDITFTLSDRDLERFKSIVGKTKSEAAGEEDQAEIEKAAYKIVDVAMNSDLPDFIADRLLQLKVLLEMIRDEEWGIDPEDRSRIVSAMSYFADPIDLIPDHIPGIGFLDDARPNGIDPTPTKNRLGVLVPFPPQAFPINLHAIQNYPLNRASVSDFVQWICGE